MTRRSLKAALWCLLSAGPLLAPSSAPLNFDGLHHPRGDAEIARLEFERSLAAARATGDRLSQAYSMIGLALLDERAGDSDSAEKRVRDASAIVQRPEFLGQASMWLAHELSPLGNTPNGNRSRAWLRVAVEEFRKLNASRDLARALHVSTGLMVQGMAKRRTLGEALSAARDGGDVRDIAVIEADWGEALRMSGDLAGAIEHIQAAIARLEALGAWADTGRALWLLGRAYASHGRFREAEAALGKAEAMYEKARDAIGLLQTRGELGVVVAAAGDRRRAVEILDRVREDASGSQIPRAIKLRVGGLAFAYLAVKEYKKASEVAEQILYEFPFRAPATTYWALSAAYYHLGRYGEAVTAATTAISRADDSAINQKEARRSRALALEKLGRLEEAVTDIQEAARLDDSVRGRLFPDDEWKRAFEETRTPLAQDVIALLWRAGKKREALEASELFRARAFLDLLASRATGSKVAGVELASASFAASASVNDLSAFAARSGVSVLSYWVHPEAVYGWLISPQGDVTGFRTRVSAGRLNDLVKRVRSLSYKPDRSAWCELYSILIQPVRPLLPAEGKTLVVVPHEILLQLPFNALTDSSGRYLAEDYVLLEAPSAAYLLRPQNAKHLSGRLLLIGDPVATALASLPGAGAELRKIASLAPGNNLLLNRKLALESRLRKEAPNARVVHFATHAIIDSKQPFESFLALSNGDKLTAGEVYDLGLHADLVMLSACRSGSGIVSSDGLLGLTRAFLYAGASRVIAPLWDVPDEPTALLVEEFYRHYLAGVSPGRALRAAQLKLLAELRAGRVVVQTPAGAMTLPEHPALWAGFILLGNE